MVYGPDTVDNYANLSKLSKIIPIFPDVNNSRSIIYTDNLCEFIRLIINSKERGLFYTQNNEYVKTSDTVKFIGEANKRIIYQTNLFNLKIKMIPWVNIINKVFEDLIYSMDKSDYKYEYRICNFTESIKLTEENRSI